MGFDNQSLPASGGKGGEAPAKFSPEFPASGRTRVIGNARRRRRKRQAHRQLEAILEERSPSVRLPQSDVLDPDATPPPLVDSSSDEEPAAVDDLGDDTSDDDAEEEKVETIKSKTRMAAEYLLWKSDVEICQSSLGACTCFGGESAPKKTQEDDGAMSRELFILLGDLADGDLPLGSLEARPGFKLVEAVFDTGAVHSCVPPGIFPGPILASAMSRAGKKYRGPDKSPIPNLGQLTGRFETEDNMKVSLLWQVANIERPLIAGAQITAAGNTVELDATSGKIVCKKTGRTIKLHKRGGADGGVYVVKMWIPDGPAAGFPRQGKKQ